MCARYSVWPSTIEKSVSVVPTKGADGVWSTMNLLTLMNSNVAALSRSPMDGHLSLGRGCDRSSSSADGSQASGTHTPMEHGEQTLPTNDLFVYLPVQILPGLVVAMERQGFTPAEEKGVMGIGQKKRMLRTTGGSAHSRHCS